MDLVRTSIRQPVTVAVGVLLVLLAGFLALQRIPIQLTPNVEDTIVAVTTRWEGASPQEVEQNIVDPQEERLQGITGLKRMTSVSQQGQGLIRLEFDVGTPKELALREVSDKLRQVPSYPVEVDEPVVDASDPENRDYIAWIVFECSDRSLDVRELQDFAEDRIKPVFERVPGISEINVLGGRERETQVRFDPARLAQLGIPVDALAAALRGTNENVSAGALDEAGSDVRLRMVSQYESVRQVEDTLVAETGAGPIYVRDVAEVRETFKESSGFVRSRGNPVIAINAQREVGSNVMQVMGGLQAAIADLNAPGSVLDSLAERMDVDGEFTLTQVFDQTIYIDDALALVQNNIWIGGGLAILVLVVFLGSIRSAAIIALSIPISVIGAIVFLVALGRSVNVISLAGMAFAVGMVVDNAIVVLENVFRHLEMGKTRMRAAYDGAREVFGAVLASTLTTIVVFVPILLIEEEAGQLFRDIALAIVASVALSLIVSITVIPCAGARLLKEIDPTAARKRGRLDALQRPLRPLRAVPDGIAKLVHALTGSVVARILIVATMTAASLVGTYLLLPPAEYLPSGNRNLVFGIILTPPGLSIAQQEDIGLRIEAGVRPYFEAGRLEPGTEEYEEAAARLPEVPTREGALVQPPPLKNYFLVAFPGAMFHGGIASEDDRVADVIPLFDHATRQTLLPGVLAFAQQVPLFRVGGRSGSAIEINFSGDDLDRVVGAAGATYVKLMGRFGVRQIEPNPGNFDLTTPELRVLPDLQRLGEAGMTPARLGLAVQALGDGAFLGDYVKGSQTIDLKLVASTSFEDAPLAVLGDVPIATPAGRAVPLSALGTLRRVDAPIQVNRIGRQRSVSLQLTAPPGIPLGAVMEEVDGMLAAGRADGSIPSEVQTSYSGSASKLDAVKNAMLGDGTLAGVLGSSLALALLVVYLLMCILFQSFLRPLIILFSVPLATLGGFVGLNLVHRWSLSDRYMPAQNMDVLTMLGFVILIGIVVNNAILIVHQSIQFMKGTGDEGELGEPLPPRRAITEAVRSRVRPIFMSTMTSVLGMSPLILMPGAGSELYRGLGSVVVGGLLVSTVFTLLLVPLLLSLVSDLQDKLGLLPEHRGAREEVGAPRASLATTAAVLVCASLLVGACSAPREPRRAPLGAIASQLVREELERLDAAPALVPRPSPSADVAAIVAAGEGRLAELEELGGPASYRDVELSLDAAGAPIGAQPITLADCVDLALAQNLALERSRLQAEIDAEEIAVQRGVFDDLVFSTVEGEVARTPNRVPVLGGIPLGAPESAASRLTSELGVARLLSGGATMSLSTFLERLDDKTDGISFEPDPAWRSGVVLGLTQPLWRGHGERITGAGVELADYAARGSEAALEAERLSVVALAQQAWWDVAEAWSALRIRRHLVDQGVEVERVLRERLAFDAAPSAYSDALATLTSRRKLQVEAERVLRFASDALRIAIGDDDLVSDARGLLAPDTAEGDPLDAEAIRAVLEDAEELDLATAITTALGARPEIDAALLAIEDAALRETLAADLKRPRLDLNASVGLTGLDDGPWDTYESLGTDDSVTALLGISFEHPIGARSARAAERQAQLRSLQTLAAFEDTLRGVLIDVKTAARDVHTTRALLDQSHAARIAAAENLRTILLEEESRERLTPEFLALKLGRQDRLGEAQLAEVRALAAHQRAQAAYRRAIGAEPR